jgi:hypothetical protein
VKVEERSRSSVLKLFRVSQKGGDLECSRCWCGIVVESTRAGWSDDSSGIPDPSADCGLAVSSSELNAEERIYIHIGVC